MDIARIDVKTIRGKLAAILSGLGLSIVAGFAVVWSFAGAMATQTELIEGAEFAVELSPNDPQVHFALAMLSGKEFDVASEDRSVEHFQRSAALSPYNYLIWLDLGRAFERGGDVSRAEAAFRRASVLAPFYSTVQWSIGNFLVRQQRYDEAFEEIRKAAEGDEKYAGAAASIAIQVFSNDLEKVRAATGDSKRINAGLAMILAKQGRSEDAMMVWRSIEPTTDEVFDSSSKFLIDQMIAQKRFRDAAEIHAVLRPAGIAIPQKGMIHNGGFEEAVDLTGGGRFSWVGDGPDSPLIGLTPSQRLSGQFSLLLAFRETDISKGVRRLSQTVVVEPGRRYRFSLSYRSEMKPATPLVWRVHSAADDSVLAAIPISKADTDWTTEVIEFGVPQGVDGIELRLGTTECAVGKCVFNGDVWFDDLELTLI